MQLGVENRALDRGERLRGERDRRHQIAARTPERPAPRARSGLGGRTRREDRPERPPLFRRVPLRAADPSAAAAAGRVVTPPPFRLPARLGTVTRALPFTLPAPVIGAPPATRPATNVLARRTRPVVRALLRARTPPSPPATGTAPPRTPWRSPTRRTSPLSHLLPQPTSCRSPPRETAAAAPTLLRARLLTLTAHHRNPPAAHALALTACRTSPVAHALVPARVLTLATRRTSPSLVRSPEPAFGARRAVRVPGRSRAPSRPCSPRRRVPRERRSARRQGAVSYVLAAPGGPLAVTARRALALGAP